MFIEEKVAEAKIVKIVRRMYIVYILMMLIIEMLIIEMLIIEILMMIIMHKLL